MSKGATTQEAIVPQYLQDLYTDASERGLAAADMLLKHTQGYGCWIYTRSNGC